MSSSNLNVSISFRPTQEHMLALQRIRELDPTSDRQTIFYRAMTAVLSMDEQELRAAQVSLEGEAGGKVPLSMKVYAAPELINESAARVKKAFEIQRLSWAFFAKVVLKALLLQMQRLARGQRTLGTAKKMTQRFGLDLMVFRTAFDSSKFERKGALNEAVRRLLEEREPELLQTLRDQTSEWLRGISEVKIIPHFLPPRPKTDIRFITKALSGLILCVAAAGGLSPAEALCAIEKELEEGEGHEP